MGAALLGAAVGDEVEYEAPTGAVLKVKVLAIVDPRCEACGRGNRTARSGSRATLVSHRSPATVLAMRLRLILVLAALLVSSCSDDDSLDAFVEVEPEIVIETEALDVDIDALEEAATDTDAEVDEPAPIEIPDDALDLSGMDQVALGIQDNAFTQRVVVVSAGTEITWTNQGRNEHNVRPAVVGAFEPISTLDLAEKGTAPRSSSRPPATSRTSAASTARRPTARRAA